MELRQIGTTLWKWAWLIVLATAVAVASSWWVVRGQAPTYQTSTTLMVGLTIQEVSPDYSEFYTAQQLAQTYVQLLRREPVLKATAAALGFEGQWRSLRGQVSAALVEGTQLMEIRVVDTDPLRAKQIADEIARQLIAVVAQARPQGSSREFIEEQVAILSTKIQAAQKEIAAMQTELSESTLARDIQNLQAQINNLEQQVNSWRASFAQYSLLLGDTGVNVLTVVEEAPLPTYPMGSRRMMQVALAGAIGFMLAVGAAFLIEYLDDTVKSPQDVERRTNLSTLGTIIRFPATEAEGPLTALEPRSPIAEGYRVLRTNLQFAAMGMGKSAVVLMVTSAQPSEGKTNTAANLAVSLAQAGRRVLLVDADLRRPTLHKLFNLSKEAGLTSLLLEREADLERVVRKTAVDGLRVLPSGPVPANPAEVLGFAEMRALLERFRTMADYVLLDSPPVLSVADASVLAQQVDGVLMVVEAGRTRTEMFERAVAVLQRVKARVLGTILTKVGARRGASAYDYYYYYSDYESDQEGAVRRKKKRSGEGTSQRQEQAKGGFFGRRPKRHAPGAAVVQESVRAGTPSRVAATAPRIVGEAGADKAASSAGEAVAAAGGAAARQVQTARGIAEAPTGVMALPVEASPEVAELVVEVPGGAPVLPGRVLPQAEADASVLAKGDALYAEAMEHYQKGEWAQAHEGLLRLKAEDPTRADLDALLRDVQLAIQRDRAEQRASRKSEAVLGDSSRVVDRSGRSRILLWPILPVALVLLLATGVVLVSTGVVKLPNLGLPFLGNRAQTYISLGYDAFGVDDYELAIENFNKALEVDPDNAEAKVGLQHATEYKQLRDLYTEAQALIAQNSFDEAIAKLETIIEMDPWYKDADVLLRQSQSARDLEERYGQAMAYYNAGDWSQAADAFEALQGKGVTAGEAEIKSKLFDSYLNESRQQIATADNRSAIIRATLSLNSALALFPDDAIAQEERQLATLYLAGYTAYEQAEWRQTISDLSGVWAIQPDYAQGKAAQLLCESYTRLGDQYQANGELQDALGQYRIVLTVTQCDHTEAQSKAEQVQTLLEAKTPTPTATP